MKKFLMMLTAACIVVLDQLIKLWALSKLAPVGSIPVIPGFFSLTYVENRGAAFGLLQDKTAALALISGALLLAIIAALAFGKFKNGFLVFIITIGAAGGIGNLYDRIFRGFVVDYLDFSALFGFPVFNLADCCVVIATSLILIYFLKSDQNKQTFAVTSNEDEV